MSHEGLPRATPEEVGLSSERLERLNRAMRSLVDRKQLAGTATLIARRGKIVHFGTFGHALLEDNAPIREDTLYRIASMTKPITSLALMMLYEEGKFLLNDPVGKHLPEFRHSRVYESGEDGQFRLVEPKRPMTVRHLLTHTSGLTYGGPKELEPFYKFARMSNGLEDSEDTLDRAVERLGAAPLLF
ncbi:MAG: serine hydrolase, partial [Candidatus Poribacteria bacterium]|nr:serine hydrolase [Candidatus Poribacteria bacterium]